MKKVININFQGSVIPMEETAFAILTQYIDSLKIHFANEEGKDEIISDIENRIAELFSERLKKGTACITDDDVDAIINSMGRPEDFDLDTDEPNVQAEPKAKAETNQETSEESSSAENHSHKQLFRDENNKKLGGVCAGVANYFNIDPVVIRILAIIFSSVCFVPYIVMWIVIPSTAAATIGATRKRLFRNGEDKKIAGVASGLAAYFGVNTKIVRILFLIPLLSIVLNNMHWMSFDFPHFISLSFTPSMVMIYIILWIVIPEATTTSEKLEMRGQPVDLNSIKDTIQNDLEGFKWGKGKKNAPKKDSNKSSFTSEDESTTTSTNTSTPHRNSGLGDGIALLFKIFAYFVIGVVLFAIVAALFGFGIAFLAALPAKDYFINNGWESIFAWGTFIFFIWVPFIAIITWIVRLITKRKNNSSVYRTSFICFWGLGWICLFALISFMGKDFSHSYKTPENNYTFDKNVQTLYIDGINNEQTNFYNLEFNSFRDYLEFFGNDSINVGNIYLNYETSKDSLYHISYYKYANGNSSEQANENANNIFYTINSKDSSLSIPNYFSISRKDKFRNQKVMIKVSIPLGKKIYIKNNLDIKHQINVSFGEDGNFGIHSENGENLNSNTLYIMTENGLKSVNNNDTPTEEKSTPAEKTTPKNKKGVYEYHLKNEETNADENNGDEKQASISSNRDEVSFSRLGFASIFLQKLTF